MKDATLGGYLREHERPPAFAGPDGGMYTVEILTDSRGEPAKRWYAYLFFLRWQGQEPVDHVETDYLSEGADEEEARTAVERLTLHEVKGLLDRLVAG